MQKDHPATKNTSVRLLKSSGEEIGNQTGSSHLSHVKHKGRAYYRVQGLAAGTYYAEVKSSDGHGYLPTSIIGSANGITHDRGYKDDPVPLGQFSESFRYTWTADTRDPFYNSYLFGLSSEMYCMFELTKPMWVFINNYGSELDLTFIHLMVFDPDTPKQRTTIDSFTSYYYQFPEVNKPAAIEPFEESMEEMSYYDKSRDNGFVLKYLEAGLYFVASSGLSIKTNGGGVITNGVIRLNIYGFADEEYENIGIISYDKTARAVQASGIRKNYLGNKYNGLEFSCEQVIGLSVTLDGNRSTPVQLTLSGDPLGIPDQVGTNELKLDSLPPGSYRLNTSGENPLSYIIRGQKPNLAGNSFTKPVNVGKHTDSFVFNDTRDMRCYSNEYNGCPGEDIFYRFTIDRAMDIRVLNYGARTDGTCITLLSSTGNKLAETSSSDNAGSASGGRTATLTIPALPAGTYFIVSENKVSEENELSTQIIGTTPGAPVSLLQPSMSKNFILTTTATQPVADVSMLNAENSLTTVNYYDGLGRAEQKVQFAQAPGMLDITTHQEYDNAGRPSRS